MPMIWVDYIILGVIGVSALISLMRGFVREAVSLLFLVLAIWLAIALADELAVHLIGYIELPSLRLGAAFVALLLVMLILGGLVNFILGKLVDKVGLSGTDRVLGMVFGALRGGLLVAVLVFLGEMTVLPQDPWWQQSTLLPHFERLADWLGGFLPDGVSRQIGL